MIVTFEVTESGDHVDLMVSHEQLAKIKSARLAHVRSDSLTYIVSGCVDTFVIPRKGKILNRVHLQRVFNCVAFKVDGTSPGRSAHEIDEDREYAKKKFYERSKKGICPAEEVKAGRASTLACSRWV